MVRRVSMKSKAEGPVARRAGTQQAGTVARPRRVIGTWFTTGTVVVQFCPHAAHENFHEMIRSTRGIGHGSWVTGTGHGVT